MAARIIVALLCLVSLSAISAPQIQHWQTENGTRVYFIEAHELPMVDIQLSFDAGSARDPGDRAGLSAMTSSLLSEGAGGLNADELGFEFERLGANFGANAGYDYASVSLRTLAAADKLQPAVANMKRVLSSPDFPEQAIERQRQRFLVGIQQKKQSPGAVASEAFYQAVYGEHPYAKPPGGTEESIKAISRAQIISFHEKYYVAGNAIVAIVGDLSRKQAEELAQGLTAEMKKGARVSSLPKVQKLRAASLVKEQHPSTQTHILLGQPGMKRGDPDYFPLYVGNHILGGSGLVSILFKEVREKRALSYSAYSYFSPMRENGPFLAGLSTRSDQADEALSVLREVIQGFIEKGPKASALEAAKKNITGGFPLRIDSNSNLLGYASIIGFYNLPLDYLETFNDKIMAVSQKDIKEAMERRLQPEKLVAVMVGPLSQENGSQEKGNQEKGTGKD